ncbi:MAG TPA: zinc-binding dehydrogenase, partial [bacterium]|nr:zinc-binding dehydrogenase [bacterium]
AEIIMIDMDENRLQVAKTFGATKTVNSGDGKAVEAVLALTAKGEGVDVAIEAVGVPSSFLTCQGIIAPGGRIANIGVHGKPVELHMEKLWDRNIAITTRLVDTVTIPMLLKVVQSGKLDAKKLSTHVFNLSEVVEAYETFGNAAKEKALKVILRG